ncbi:MAG: NfeD family protein [Clostridia bacterium]|nr:NfeD family protein [Clostridia bacterium]
MHLGVIWLIAVVVFTILEMSTYQLVSIWFAVGAVGSMISAFLGANLIVQITVFVILSAVCVIFTRPAFKKLLGNKIQKTNADSLIGKTAVVTVGIDNLSSKGQVKVNGMNWTARSIDGNIIGENNKVTIEKIEGVKLIVKKVEE